MIGTIVNTATIIVGGIVGALLHRGIKDKYKEVLKRKTMLGGSVGYYYNSPTGPVGASLGYSNVTDKLTFYFNLGFVF